jgi:hypothetical protein
LALEIFSWIAGGLSVVFNVVAVANCVKELSKSKSHPSLMTWVLVLLISLSDLLMGFYLITIASLTRYHGAEYCKKKFEWLTSSGCKALGVVNSVASQLSLFSMTVLSISRLMTMSSRKIVTESATAIKSLVKIGITTFVVLFSSALIAAAPVMHVFEDFFVNGLYYHENPLFIASVTKTTHCDLIGSYYGRYKNRPLNWQVIRKEVAYMFSHDQGG